MKVSTENLHADLGWLKLSDRRELHKLYLFYKMQHGLVPDYLADLVPARVGDNTTYPLRKAENFIQVHASSRSYFESYLPSTIRAWNSLPSDTRTAPSLASFKYKFEKDLPKIPKYYYCGDGKSQILHTRLRTECSILRYYLHKKKLIPDALCPCGAVENNNHYLIE